MRVTTTRKGCYEVMVTDGELQIINTLAEIYDMKCSDIVKYMFSFSSYMAVTRIINKVNES